jgi:hypothetical protein
MDFPTERKDENYVSLCGSHYDRTLPVSQLFSFLSKGSAKDGHNKGESILPAAAQHLAYKQSNAKFLRVSSSSCLLEY